MKEGKDSRAGVSSDLASEAVLSAVELVSFCSLVEDPEKEYWLKILLKN